MAQKTPGEYEKEFMAGAKKETGKSLKEWLTWLPGNAPAKRNEILAVLKTNHGLNHMQASLLTGIYLNGGKPVYSDEENLMETHFAKFPLIRPLFDALEKHIMSSYPNTKVIPKKTYISFTDKREFAAVNTKADHLRVGMDLGDYPFDDYVSKSKLTGPMPRISHMVEIKAIGDLSVQFDKLLKESYNRCH